MYRMFSTLGCPDFTLPEVFALARRHGFSAVEVRALAGTTDLAGYFERTYGTPAELATLLRDEPVKIVSFGTSLQMIGSGSAARTAFLRLVPWAEALGVGYLRVFDGGTAADAPEMRAAAAFVDWWRQLRSTHGWRVDIAVETHDSLLGAAAINRFLAIAPGTAIRWDAHHTWRKGGEHPVLTWPEIRPHVVMIDVKDSVTEPDSRPPYRFVLPGAGEFPFAALRDRLRGEYVGALNFEWESLWVPTLPPLDTALYAATDRGWL